MAQYLKLDTEKGYIEDVAEIEKLKFNNLRHSVLGCMLGDFNEVGNYVVSKEIVKELISMEKYVDKTYENIELCKSFLKLDKQISFLITFEGNRATLSLIEKLNYEGNFALNSGTYSNINEYVLDSVETSGEINRNMIYIRWNVRAVPGNVIDIFNCSSEILEKYFGIVNRFKYILETNKIVLQNEEVVEEIEAEYANEMFTILERYPTLKNAVIENLNTALTEKKNAISVKKPFFAKTFNELLENAINQNLSVLSEVEGAEFDIEKRNAVVNLNLNRQGVIETELCDAQDNNQNSSPKGIRIKTDPNYNLKSIIELGGELVGANKTATENRNKDIVDLDLIQRTILAIGEKKGLDVVLPGEQNSNVELNKLKSKLKGYGLSELVGIVNPKQAKTDGKEIGQEKITAFKPEVKKSTTSTKPEAKKDNSKGKGSSSGKGKAKGKKSEVKVTDSTSTTPKTEDYAWMFAEKREETTKATTPRIMENKFNPNINRRDTNPLKDIARRQDSSTRDGVEILPRDMSGSDNLQPGL